MLKFFKNKDRHFSNIIHIKDESSNQSFKMQTFVDSYIENEIATFGLYGRFEKESLRIWAFLSKYSHNIIDVGANTGIYSMLAKTNNNQANVLAVEPIDYNFKVLKSNINLNNYSVFTEKVALSNVNGEAKMFMFKDRLNYMTSVNENRYIHNPHVIEGKEIIETIVPLVRFEVLFERYQFNGIDLMKIDVEGHEIEVLSSLEYFLDKFHPTILIEVISDSIANGVQNILSKYNYMYIAIDEESKPKLVDKIWDNNHHNFLICTKEIVRILKENDLII